MKTLTADVASMESAKDHAFAPPPRPWIEDRIKKLNEVLAQRTEKSALALRRLAGPVTLTPQNRTGRAAFLHGRVHVPELEPPRCGRRFEFIAMVEAAGFEPASESDPRWLLRA